MSYRLPRLAPKKNADQFHFPQCAAAIAILFWLLLFNACSGGSMPGSSAAAANPATVLAISATLPPASVGSAYSAAISVTGGTAPYIFFVVSGQLPAGVLLGDNSGTISGTPTTAGGFSFAVSVSDSKGLSEQKSLQLTVANTSTTTNSPTTTSPTTSPTTTGGGNGGNSFSHLQHSGGWAQFGQRGPKYIDCSPSPCDGISFWMVQDVDSPSISGQASEFNVGGSGPFADALWNNHLIGPSSSQGLPDTDQTLVPSLHNFTYDVYFYGDNLGLAQALEFDINQFFGNMGFIFGHECRLAGGNEWDVWDDQNSVWKPTGISCHPNNNSWNHLTIKVQRTSNNDLVYQSITLNGVTNNLNWTFGHGSAPNWYGLTINYQMDGNYHQDSYNVYLDTLTFSYD
ncbi:MAG: Ig domain-containing protein [Candidatus Sulfotelmatobacter sp.]